VDRQLHPAEDVLLFFAEASLFLRELGVGFGDPGFVVALDELDFAHVVFDLRLLLFPELVVAQVVDLGCQLLHELQRHEVPRLHQVRE
jgi:hypothetical protein